MSSVSLRSIISRISNADIANASDENTLAEIGATSSEIVAIMVRVEEELGFHIDYSVISGLQTIGDFQRYLDEAE